MTHDTTRGTVVFFGGATSSTSVSVNAETWERSGTTWTRRMVTGPSARYFHAMAYDAAREVSVLFGGASTTSASAETWEWDGTAWNQRIVNGPSRRLGHKMVYDAARGVTVLFGGNAGMAGTYSAETWEWDGAAWTQRVFSGPSARRHHGMAYDAARGVTVLFGGQNADLATPINAQTWEWNGITWTQRLVSGPSARYLHSMVYDAARGVTVLFGGQLANGTLSSETWEWDGVAWTQRMISGPSARSSHAMAYDASLGTTVLFGGIANDIINAETWELQDPSLCSADLDNDGSLGNGGVRDRAVTIDDLLFLLTAFEAGSIAADLDNGTNTGVRDNAVTIEDLLYFLVHFEEGC
jgi:hypothetical protein